MKNLLLAFCLFSWGISLSKPNERTVQFDEAYELANIILALTEYGLKDKNEVNKHTQYYQEVIEYFKPTSNHPLLEKVNYSREKWDKLLSFRTDAVAFVFNKKSKLKRKHRFYSMGEEINEFEENIELIQDFVGKSNFRTFYQQHLPYFNSLAELYEKSLMLDEIHSFLEDEFKMKSKSKHRIIVSPLVGRMHCQRPFNKASTSFINIPTYIYNISSVTEITKRELASGLHMYFTEVDHDFVNPTTEHFKKEYQLNFDSKKWDKNSGYGKWEMAVFNEYMTWAVYDVFVQWKFPEVADSVISNWHKANESRGFFASTLFGKQLLKISESSKKNIKALYPELLFWCKEVENIIPTLIDEKK